MAKIQYGVKPDIFKYAHWPTHNIVPHISLHDQPCHRAMNFSVASAEILDSTMVLQLSTISLLITLCL